MTSTLPNPIVTAPAAGIGITVSHGALMSALDVFRSVAPLRPPVPILGGVKVAVDSGRVSASIFDYTTSVSIDLGATDSIDGSIVVPFRTLDERAKALVKGTTKARAAALDVTLTETATAVPAVQGDIDPECAWKRNGAVPAVSGQSSLVADGYTYTIPTMPVDEYPDLPVNNELSAFTEVDRDELVKAVTRAKIAAGKDDTLPMLTGILITWDAASGGINLVATDRFRLNVAPIATATVGDVKALVPAAELVKLVKHLPSGMVGVEFDGKTVYLTAGPVKASIRLIDSEFVRYAALLPTELQTTMLVNRKALITAVERVAVAVDRGHHIRLTVDQYGVVLTAGGDDDGRATSPVISGAVDGTDLLIAANPAYLLDALKADTSDDVAMGFTTPNRPMMFAGTVADLTSTSAFRQLVMPARLPG